MDTAITILNTFYGLLAGLLIAWFSLYLLAGLMLFEARLAIRLAQRMSADETFARWFIRSGYWWTSQHPFGMTWLWLRRVDVGRVRGDSDDSTASQ